MSRGLKIVFVLSCCFLWEAQAFSQVRVRFDATFGQEEIRIGFREQTYKVKLDESGIGKITIPDSLVPGYAVLYGPRNAYSFYLVPGQQQEITRLNGQEIKFAGAAKAINIYLNSPFLNNRDPGYEKGEEEICPTGPINALTEELKEIDIRIVEMEQEKSVAAYWFAARTVDLCDKELVCCKSDLRKLEDRLKELKVQKGELEQEQMRLTVAIEKDEVGQQIHEIEKEINQRVRIRDNRKAKAEEYDKLAKLVKMEQSPDVEEFEINRATAKREKDALQVTIDRQLMEEKRQAQNRQDEISSNIEERMATIRYLQQHKNNISGRVAEIRDEILEAVGATTEEIPFIGELICVKDDERDWEYSIERILHNFALRLVVPEKYYKQVNEYVNGHNLRGRIVYQRYQGAETIREFG